MAVAREGAALTCRAHFSHAMSCGRFGVSGAAFFWLLMWFRATVAVRGWLAFAPCAHNADFCFSQQCGAWDQLAAIAAEVSQKPRLSGDQGSRRFAGLRGEFLMVGLIRVLIVTPFLAASVLAQTPASPNNTSSDSAEAAKRQGRKAPGKSQTSAALVLRSFATCERRWKRLLQSSVNGL